MQPTHFRCAAYLPPLFVWICVFIAPDCNAQKNDVYNRYVQLVNKYSEVVNLQQCYLLKNRNKYGLADEGCNIILPAVYDEFHNVSGRFEFVRPGDIVHLDYKLNVVQRGTRRQPDNTYPDRLPYIFNYKDGYYGVTDTGGELILPYKYQGVDMRGRYIVGFLEDDIDVYSRKDGKLIGSFNYDDLRVIDTFTVVKRYGNWALANSSLKPITSFLYKSFFSLKSQKHIGFKQDYQGAMDASGQVVLNSNYNWIFPYGLNCYIVQLKSYPSERALYDEDFKQLIPFSTSDLSLPQMPDSAKRVAGWINTIRADNDSLDNTSTFSISAYNTTTRKYFPFWVVGSLYNDKLVKVITANTAAPYHYVTSNGAPFNYEIAGNTISSGYLVVKKGNLAGLMDSGLNLVFPLQYRDIVVLNNSVFALADTMPDTGYSIVNREGKLRYPNKMQAAPTTLGSFYITNEKGKFGLLNGNFKPILPACYDKPFIYAKNQSYWAIDSSYLILYKDNKMGVADTNGNIIIPPIYQQLNLNRRYFAISSRIGRYKLADKQGTVLPRDTSVKDYVLMNDFGDMLYQQNNKWGMVNCYNDTLWPFVYDSLRSCCGDHYSMWKNGRYSLINKVGTLVAGELPNHPQKINETKDTIACTNGDIYARVKGTHFTKISSPQFLASGERGSSNRNNFVVVKYSQPSSPFRTGIFSKSGKWLAPYWRAREYNEMAGRMLIPDSAGKSFAVIDTGGNYLVPATKADEFRLVDHIAIVRSGSQYLVYNLARSTVPDTTFDIKYAVDNRNFDYNNEPGPENYYSVQETHGRAKHFVYYKCGINWMTIDPHTGRALKTPERLYALSEYDTALVMRKKGRWGIINMNNKWLVPPVYDYIFTLVQYGEIAVVKKGKMGLLGSNYKEKIPPVYDSIYQVERLQVQKFFVAKKEGSFLLADQYNNVLSRGWDKIVVYGGENTVIHATLNGIKRQLVVNKDGKFEKGDTLDNYDVTYVYGDEIQIRKDHKLGIKDLNTGEIIIPMIYDEIRDNAEGYVATIASGPECGTYIYDKKGKKISAQPCGATVDFTYGYGEVRGSDTASAIDHNGKVLVPGGYHVYQRLGAELFVVSKGDDWHTYGLIGKDRKLIVPVIYKLIVGIGEGVFYADAGKKDHILLLRNDTVETHSYDWARLEHQCRLTRIRVTENGKKGVVDKKCEPVLHSVYDEITVVCMENEANRPIWWLVQKNKKWGVVDENGRAIIPFRYEALQQFGCDPEKYYAKKRDKWGLIDNNEKIILPFTYSDVKDMKTDIDKLYPPPALERTAEATWVY